MKELQAKMPRKIFNFSSAITQYTQELSMVDVNEEIKNNPKESKRELRKPLEDMHIYTFKKF